MVNWVVDDNILNSPSNVGDMVGAIKKSGANLFRTKYIPFADKQNYGPKKLDKSPTILYGSVSFIKKCNRKFFPGAFGVSELMNCNHYYSNIPNNWLLNEDFVMLPFSAIKHNIERLLKMFEGHFFIRPNSGFKTFAGFVITEENYERELSSSMQLTSVMPETICLLSSVKNLQGEFRFVIGNREVIDGSEYRWDNILDVRKDYPKECWQMADKMAKLEWQPDIVYTVDVALNSLGPKIIEINSFSSAGLYACDRELVVSRINDIAEKMYAGTI